MKLSEIHINPKNPRIIKDDRFKKLVKSIEEFPKMMELRPIVVDNDGMVLGGNMRLKVLQHLKYKEIPDNWVKRADELTEEEKQRFIVSDNVGFGEWNWDELANEWDAVELEEWGLELPEDWVNPGALQAEEDDYQIPDEIHTDIVLGDLFEIGPHRLICGDSTKSEVYENLMGGKMADLVVTDPPYNVDYTGETKDALKMMNDKQSDSKFLAFLTDFYKATAQSMKPGAGIYVFHADMEGLNFRRAFIDAGLEFKQCLVWVKNSMVMGRQDYQWKHEPCLYGWKPGAAHYFTADRTNTTVIDDKVDYKKLKKEELLKIVKEIFSERTKTTVIYHDKPIRSAEHPTMKPVLLLAELIANSSKPGWAVLDPFMGSGSTMVAAHQLNRKCYGMEIDPKYCQIIIDRMRKLDPSIEIKKNGELYNATSES